MSRFQDLRDLEMAIEEGVKFNMLPLAQMKDAHSTQIAYRGDLEHARIVVRTELPGWGWRVGTCYLSDDAFVFPDFNCPISGPKLRLAGVPRLINGQEWSEFTDIDQRPAGNVARALLRSVLKALVAIEEARS